MRVLTWNINGLKAAVAKAGTLLAVLEVLHADIICLQETKLQRKELQRDLALAEGWESFFSFCSVKTGYSGVATFCRKATVGVPLAAEDGLTGAASTAAPSSGSGGGGSLGSSSGSISSASTAVLLQDELGLGLEQLQAVDAEGRALVTDHGAFLLVNLYGPALTSADSLADRLAYKLNFYKVLEWRLRQWVGAGRAVVVVGDLNISPFPIDSCDGANMDMGRPDRVWLQRLLGGSGPGVTDVFRHFHPDRPQAYSCWNTASGARQLNWGTRIDHILIAGPVPAQLVVASSRGGTAATPSSHDSSSTFGSLGTPAPAAGAPAAAAAAAVGPCSLVELSSGADIMSDHQGSDHAPVWADLDIPQHCFPTPACLPALASSRIFPGRNMSLKAWLQQQQPQDSQQQQQQKPQEPQQEQQQEKAQQQPAKRARVDSKTSSSNSRGSKGSSSKSGSKSQPSLLGFMGFQRLKPPTPAAAAQASQQQQQDQPDAAVEQQQQQQPGGLEESQQQAVQPEPPQQQQQQQQQQQHVLDPEVQQALDSKHQETVAAWQRISQRLQPPLCSGHREPSVIRTVKKAGANSGRQFYCCARTAGPPPQGRCSFFVWANAQRTVKGAPAAAAAAAPRSQ